MARSRKKTGPSNGASGTSDREAATAKDAVEIEDAEILEETGPDAPETVEATDAETSEDGSVSEAVSEEGTSRPEDDGAPEEAGDQVAAEATEPEDTGETGQDGAVDEADPENAPEEDLTAEGADATEAGAETGDDAPEAEGTEPDTPGADPAETEEHVGASIVEAVPDADETAQDDATGSDRPESAPSPAVVPPAKTQTSILPFVIMGVVAGLIGYGAAMIPELRRDPSAPTPEKNARAIDAQSSRIEGFGQDVSAIAARDFSGEITAGIEEGVAPLGDRLLRIEKRLDRFSGDLQALTERVETIAMRPVATGIDAEEFDDAISEFREQLNAAISNAQTEIGAARDEAARISEEAFSAEQNATARAAWEQVRAAFDTGAPYGDSLTVVEDLLEVEAPEALAANAEAGIPTLPSLQQGFAAEARGALTASIRGGVEDGTMDRLKSFFRVQSGVRSLTPQDGDDPDAVLSRAEDALRNANLEAALTELEGLPEGGRAEMADWEDRARRRLATLEAADAMSKQLNWK